MASRTPARLLKQKDTTKGAHNAGTKQHNNLEKKAATWIVAYIGWKPIAITGLILALLAGLAVMLGSSSASTAALEETTNDVFPDSWNIDTLFDNEEDYAEVLHGDEELYNAAQTMRQCVSQGQDKLDPALQAAAEMVEQDTRAEYARAWILYLTSTVEGRSILVHNRPELRTNYEGTILTAEDFQHQGLPAYTQDDIYHHYADYQNAAGGGGNPEDFIHRISDNANPEGFQGQVNATMWLLSNKKIVTDSPNSTFDDLLESCELDL